GPAVSRGHGIDEDEVGKREPGVVVVDEAVRRWQRLTLIAHEHALGTDRAQVQPNRRGARAAVESKSNRAPRGAAVLRIGDEEDVRLELSVLVLHRHEAGGRGVLEGPSAGRYFVMGYDPFLFLGRLLIRFLLFLLALVFVGGLFLVAGGGRGRARGLAALGPSVGRG